MVRRLVPLVALAVASLLGIGGCADDVAPAARVGDVTISHDDLLAEVEEWRRSPTLIAQLQLAAPDSVSANGVSTQFLGDVLEFRIGFELHHAEFDRLGLELDEADVDLLRQGGLFQDPTATAKVLDELRSPYADRLLREVARQFAVQEALADEYPTWATAAYGDDRIEVNPRYGSWDAATGTVTEPEGPREPPTSSTPPLLEP